MQYYKFIELSNLETIQIKVLNFIKIEHPEIYAKQGVSNFNHLDVNRLKTACPELEESFFQLGLTIISAATHVMNSKYQTVIHIDNVPWQARINIPLLNCEGSRTVFYSNEQVKHDTLTMEGGKSYPITIVTNPNECIEEASYELISPLVLRVSSPHKVFMNELTVPRIALTIGCDPDPVFMLNP